MSTTDQQLLNEAQYQTVESPNSGASWSALWTVSEISGYLNQRQRRILYETGCILTRTVPPINTPANTQRFALPPDWIQTRRVTWKDPSGNYHPLLHSEIYYLDYGLVNWEATMAPAPIVYLEDMVPTLEILIAPAASDAGTIELLYVANGATVANTGVALTIPDDLVWILKYGLLADMWGKVGRAHDKLRADYCEGRFELGIGLVNTFLWGAPDPLAGRV